LTRCQQRNISYREIKEALKTGEIIEEYPDDYPYPSCLILGLTSNARHLHVVIGLGEGKLWLITAYEPDPVYWDETFKQRKG
jgi:hypothetical protein